MVKIQLSTNFCAEQPPGGTARLCESEDNENMGCLNAPRGAETVRCCGAQMGRLGQGEVQYVVCTPDNRTSVLFNRCMCIDVDAHVYKHAQIHAHTCMYVMCRYKYVHICVKFRNHSDLLKVV